MATTVNNPTNAPHKAGLTPMPFTTLKHMQVVASGKAKPDAFNTGGDYPDEGLPLMESEINSVKKPMVKPWAFGVPGWIDPPTAAERKSFTHPDEEAQGKHLNYVESAVVVDVDAKVITSSQDDMRLGKFREAHYPSLNEYKNSLYYRRLRESKLVMEAAVRSAQKTFLKGDGKGIVMSPMQVQRFQKIDETIIRNLREAFKTDKKKGSARLREGTRRLREDIFDEGGGFGSVLAPNFDMPGNGRPQDYIPIMSGPYNKQLYWFDYLDMHSKAFEAWTHNPIAKRIIKVITQFVLGKGVKATVISADLPTGKTGIDQQTGEEFEMVYDMRPQAQNILDEHWARNMMALRGKMILRDLLIFGEQFPRYFNVPKGLSVRQIDPSTVWEVVTDPDDCENEFYLHQQYPTRYQWYVDLPVPTIKFIIRQVPSKLYYHMKINTTAGEVRGRSELFAVLGWLKRIKEFASDRVIRNKMANLFVLDVAVEGGDDAVQAAKAQFQIVPTPGSFFIHNKASELDGIHAEVGAADVTQDWDMLLTVIAMGAGVSKEYLGMAGSGGGGGGGKAGALVGTEPDVKTFEDYQEIMEQFYLQDASRCFERASELKKIPQGVDVKVEITYPALAEENRSEKLKDIAFMESMSWITHRRGSTMGAKEMQITTYEFDEEQKEIAKEDAEANILFNNAMAQVQKGQATPPKGGAGGGSSGGGGGFGSGSKGASGGPGGLTGSPASNESKFGSREARGKGWGDTDPRDIHESMLREATNTRLKTRPINRRRNIVLTPDKRRDQSSLGHAISDARKGLHGNYHESGLRQNAGKADLSKNPSPKLPSDLSKPAAFLASKRKKEAAGLMGNFQKTDGAKLQTNPKVHQVPVDKRPFKQRGKKNFPKKGPLA